MRYGSIHFVGDNDEPLWDGDSPVVPREGETVSHHEYGLFIVRHVEWEVVAGDLLDELCAVVYLDAAER